MKSLFENYWSRYASKPLIERRKYFDSLSYRDQEKLKDSFFAENWDEYVAKNFLDRAIDYIRITYGIDLLNLRFQIIYNNKTFLIEKHRWDNIVSLINTFSDYYDTNIIFGGLLVALCKNDEFYRVSQSKEI